MQLTLTEGSFRAMGSACRIVVDADESVLRRAIHRIEDLEARWSRFIPTSEVSECNRSAGRWVEVSAVTAGLFERGRHAHDRTAGRFDPLMLRQLEALGYDRDHALLSHCPTGSLPHVEDRPGSVEVDGAAVRVPAGTAFDPGGLGKGLAADLVMADLVDTGATWAMVSLGGDMRFGGSRLADQGWAVGIEDPLARGAARLTTTIYSGGLASSSTMLRRWGTERHHILDPATGLPTTGQRVASTVAADECWWAEVLAKCLIVDPTMGTDVLDRLGGRGIAFDPEADTERLGLHVEEAETVA